MGKFYAGNPHIQKWGRVLLGAASLGFALWAWHFYRNVWEVAIPAFGSPAPYLASLRALLAKYLAAGGGLLMVWWGGFAMARSPKASSKKTGGGQRQTG